MSAPEAPRPDISVSDVREAEIVAGIKAGLADMEAGRLVPHEEAMARLEESIAAVERKPS